ncbi:MAG: permease-like cell division protein FtsX [Patescibacteria group bacterium]|jgi:cell division transport system permease protein
MQIFLRIIRTAWHGFWRNGWLSLVAIFIMMQVLLLVGMFLTINLGVNKAIQSINERIDVAIFFKDYVPEADILSFQEKIKNISDIKEVKFISREQALASYTASNQSNKQLLDAIGNDPDFFPASLEIKTTDPAKLETIESQIKAQDQNSIISKTSLEKNKALISKLRKINLLLAWGDLGISFILMIIALLIIFNTIRITIFTRKEEIEIMKLVGATDWYIRWPLILEGVLYGIIGAVLAFLLTLGVYQGVSLALGSQYWSLQTLTGTTNLFTYAFAAKLFIFQLFFGVLVGSISSYLSTKRYLRV